MQQFRDGVMLRMCCGLTLATLFVRFFDRYYVATIPKSRFEFLDSFLDSIYIQSTGLGIWHCARYTAVYVVFSLV